MEEKLYDVVFLGPAQNGTNQRHELLRAMKNRFKLPDDHLQLMIEQAPITIKKGLTSKEAERYRGIFESVGAQVKLEPMAVANEEEPVFRSSRDTETSQRKSVFDSRSFFIITMISIIISILVVLGLALHRL